MHAMWVASTRLPLGHGLQANGNGRRRVSMIILRPIVEGGQTYHLGHLERTCFQHTGCKSRTLYLAQSP